MPLQRSEIIGPHTRPLARIIKAEPQGAPLFTQARAKRWSLALGQIGGGVGRR
ncbi:hypothetical protein GCM10007854_20320 [Algimonas porphyrae]|uniref:Uncharacterized protein n=1 Tax=Algimonas porphyrae TaxID=1128113 RepID=A0ABQ5V291_9PROT|nr:hypothetical protein GCM10007854_20320 [Algimonas porphyrae]